MANAILPSGEQQFSDADGKPYVGGKVYFYIPNTLTPKDTYQDQDSAILNTNPVILDSAGRAVIWGEGSYRQILNDKNGNTIWDRIVSYLKGTEAASVSITDAGNYYTDKTVEGALQEVGENSVITSLGNGKYNSAELRMPFATSELLSAAAASVTDTDFVGHLLATRVTGNFTGVPSTNPGWVYGLNVYTHTGSSAGDGDGIHYLLGALIEASIRSVINAQTVIGLQAEAAYLGAAAGGNVTGMMSLKVAAPKRKDGATSGDAATIYGTYHDAVNVGDLGSTEAYTIFSAGGLHYYNGEVKVNGTLGTTNAGNIHIGTPKLTAVSDVAGTAYNALSCDHAFGATSFNKTGDPTRRIVWGSGSPEGIIYASRGSTYYREDGSAPTYQYVKTTDAANTGWVAIRGVLTASGSPEGTVVAPVGSIYTNTAGGAGTTLYIKESGTGNTGWVAK